MYLLTRGKQLRSDIWWCHDCGDVRFRSPGQEDAAIAHVKLMGHGVTLRHYCQVEIYPVTVGQSGAAGAARIALSAKLGADSNRSGAAGHE
jgi:hypothetical protein